MIEVYKNKEEVSKYIIELNDGIHRLTHEDLIELELKIQKALQDDKK